LLQGTDIITILLQYFVLQGIEEGIIIIIIIINASTINQRACTLTVSLRTTMSTHALN